MKFRKKTIIILVASMFIAIVCFCVYFANTNSSITYYEEEPEKVEVRLLSNWNYIDGDGACFQNIINGFNENNKDMVVVNDFQPSNEYYDVLKLDFASGNEPDVFISRTGVDVKRYVQMDKILLMNDYLSNDEEWYESFDKSIWSKVSYDGKIYALPLEYVYTAMFV